MLICPLVRISIVEVGEYVGYAHKYHIRILISTLFSFGTLFALSIARHSIR
jgi:hypothetical protein